ncbi:MAG: tetraacyldisaccharide 4'-kinase [Sulfurovum sp.]
MRLKLFFEEMFFSPKIYHYPIIILLSPLSFLYGALMYIRRISTKKIEFNIPIISVGNIIVGGSGKTPFVIALASMYNGVYIISRGYGRESRGLVEVSQNGKIITTVENSGDEPMLMAQSLPTVSVIVSEDREKAIELVKKKGAKLIILDDGFNRVNIKKFEIILEPQEIKNPLPFPVGSLRECIFTRNFADIIAIEDIEFNREVSFVDLSEKMILATAISNPKRLDQYLPNGVVYKYYLEDHTYFDEDILRTLLEKYKATSILCTQKDLVKMQNFKLPISQMKLKFVIDKEIFKQVDEYIKGYENEV